MKVPFDEKLFNLTRLDIVATLDGEPPIPFIELRDVLELTDGNLNSHLKVLEAHRMVEIHKGFQGRKSHTTVELTVVGKGELEKLKDWFYQAFIEPG